MLIGYARVSTDDQDLALQLDALQGAGCDRIFTDQASGAKRDRPGLLQALDYARAGDVLCVWRLDRLGRSLLHLLETVEGLKARGVGFRSLQEAMDTTTPGGVLIFHIFGALAEFERALIRERTQAGLKAARARGRIVGRRPKLSATQQAMARRLLAAPDVSISQVADSLQVSRATIYRLLDRDRQVEHLPSTEPGS